MVIALVTEHFKDYILHTAQHSDNGGYTLMSKFLLAENANFI